jgi:hypothetical protein
MSSFAEVAELLVGEGRSRDEFDQLVAGDPGGLVRRALDPAEPGLSVIAWPGRVLRQELARGDLILRERPGSPPTVSVIAEPRLMTRLEAARESWSDDPLLAGGYVRTIEPVTGATIPLRRVIGPDGFALPGTIIVRAGGENRESGPDRPTLRHGSTGPAVAELQSRLNAISLARSLTFQGTLPACPLDVDGKFGPRTREAVIGFQHVAFPASPRDWDGIVGPRTWTALDNASGNNVGPGPSPQVQSATIEFVLDNRGQHAVDAQSPVATALMFGLWDQAYDNLNSVRNNQPETDNFVGLDRRRFYIRVRDQAATGSTVTAQWRTLNAANADLDAPASQDVTLTETSPGSKVFVSRALMLVTDETDASQDTHSGLTSGPNAGVRSRGQADHRLRIGDLEGSVRAEYTQAGAASPVSVTLPVFQRSPERRLRLNVRVVHMGINVTQARQNQINAQFRHANLRWAQAGLHIQPHGQVQTIAIPPAAQDSHGGYNGDAETPGERAVLRLINAPDNTVTVVFTEIPTVRDDGQDAFNAYTTLTNNPRHTYGDRYFIFQDVDLAEDLETLAHELHHVLHNRGDIDFQEDRFFAFNTNAPTPPLPDVTKYRRIQTLFARNNPDNDPRNENTFNWLRRRRTARVPIPTNGLVAATATTGNKLVERF